MLATEVLFALCAFGYAGVAVAVLLPRTPGRTNVALSGAAAVTAAWAAAIAASPQPSLTGVAAALDFLRVGPWFGFLLVLARRTRGQGHRWWTSGALGVLFGLVTIFLAVVAWLAPGDGTEPSLVSLGIDARLATAIAILLLVENVYRNASEEVRWHINLPCIAVSGLFLYEIFYCSDTVLYRAVSPLLFLGQAPVNLLVIPLLLIGARRQQRWKDDVGVSRSVVFHTATLVLAGIFLVGLAAAGEVLRRFGPGWGTLAEACLLFAGAVAIAVLVTSGSARSRLRGLVVDHFFTRRFDYQREWVRCIGTLSAIGPALDLHKRVIRAVADIVDSPGGVLFLRDPAKRQTISEFRAAGHWNAPQLDGVIVGAGHAVLESLDAGSTIAVRQPGAAPWFAGMPDAWLAVPLPTLGGITGFVVVLPPRASFLLDREVFDLLRIVGREVAVFITEKQATEALVEARQFAEAGQRFAFVAHDIKNVASQLSLLLGNAEHHLENPEFRVDMLATLRSSVQKISALLGRLQGPTSGPTRRLLSLRTCLTEGLDSYRGVGRAAISLECAGEDAVVEMERASFDAVIRHLVDNAVEATAEGGRVHVHLERSGERAVVTVADEGRGMTEEFIRQVLFRPFASTKQTGFGLGAFQARELLREAGGDLTVMSTPGHGTTMRITLPLAAPATVVPIAQRA